MQSFCLLYVKIENKNITIVNILIKNSLEIKKDYKYNIYIKNIKNKEINMKNAKNLGAVHTHTLCNLIDENIAFKKALLKMENER